MARFSDALRTLYGKKILLDIYISRLENYTNRQEKKETYEAMIAERIRLGRKFVHRTLAEFVDIGLLEVYDKVHVASFYRLTPNGLSMMAGATANKKSMKCYMSRPVRFGRQQQRPPSPGRKPG